MIQVGEVIDLLISIVLTFYLASLVDENKKHLKTFWFLGILLVVLSKLLTVTETFLLPNITNLVEHFSFFVASILIAISIYLKELA